MSSSYRALDKLQSEILSVRTELLWRSPIKTGALTSRLGRLVFSYCLLRLSSRTGCSLPLMNFQYIKSLLTLRTATFHNFQDRILAKSEPQPNVPVRMPCRNQIKHPCFAAIRFDSLPRAPSEFHAASLSSGNTGSYPFTQQIALEFRQRRHQGGNQLSLRRAQIKLQTRLGDHQMMKTLNLKLLRYPCPAKSA